MTIDAHKLHDKSRDRNEDCRIVAMRVANPLLRVLSMVKQTHHRHLFRSLIVSSDLSLSRIHFWTVFFEAVDFLVAGASDEEGRLRLPWLPEERPAIAYHVHY